jgi:hypothetical protein
LERTQLLHEGRFSSHFILLCLKRYVSDQNRHKSEYKQIEENDYAYLQLRHPVLTFGLLVLARFCFASPSLAAPAVLAAGEGRPAPDLDPVDIVWASFQYQFHNYFTLQKIVGHSYIP